MNTQIIALTPTVTTIAAQPSSLIDKTLQARLLRMLTKKGKPIFLSEFLHRTELTPEKIEANLEALVGLGKVAQNGKKYTLTDANAAAPVAATKVTTLKFTDFDDDQLHILAALYDTRTKKDPKEIFIALCKKVKGLKDPNVEENHTVEMNEILLGLVEDKLATVKSPHLFTLTDAGRALVEDWHRSATGEKFKSLKYWG